MPKPLTYLLLKYVRMIINYAAIQSQIIDYAATQHALHV